MGKWVIKVAIAEAHPLIREGLTALLERDEHIAVVLAAPKEISIVESLSSLQLIPDVMILSTGVPVSSDCELVIKLKHRYPRLKILVLSFYDDEYNIIRMIKAGAVGYLLKATVTAEELTTAVKNVFFSGFHLSHAFKEEQLVRMLSIHEPIITKKEIVFLNLCAEGLTNMKIAGKMNISYRTVENYNRSLFKKLKASNRVNLIIKAFRMGFIS